MMKIPETVLGGISSGVKEQVGGMGGDQACLTAGNRPLAGRWTHPVCAACVYVQVQTRITSLIGFFFGGGGEQDQQFSNSSKLTRKLEGTFRVHSPTKGLHVAMLDVLHGYWMPELRSPSLPSKRSNLPSPKTVIFNLNCSSLDYYAQISKLASSGLE